MLNDKGLEGERERERRDRWIETGREKEIEDINEYRDGERGRERESVNESVRERERTKVKSVEVEKIS